MKDLDRQYGEPSRSFYELKGSDDVFGAMFASDDHLGLEEFGMRKYYRRELRMFRALRKLNEKIGSEIVLVPNAKKGETLMLHEKVRNALKDVGSFLLAIGQLKQTIVLPGAGEELQSLVEQALQARVTGKPIPFFTPFCPDWSRDSSGRYDFRSLGGEVSYIADKFFTEARPLLKAFAARGISYTGNLIFANWGLETQIDAKDTYGRKLSSEDISMCFASCYAKTDEKLRSLQEGENGELFRPYKVVPMTDFFQEQSVDPEAAYQQMDSFFRADNKGQRLVEELATTSDKINKGRLNLTREENRQQAIQNLAEYATLGQAYGDRGIVIAAESYTSTRAYNLPRQRKLPVFFLKGKRALHEGVNIL